jgi:hypothetical protein
VCYGLECKAVCVPDAKQNSGDTDGDWPDPIWADRNVAVVMKRLLLQVERAIEDFVHNGSETSFRGKHVDTFLGDLRRADWST